MNGSVKSSAIRDESRARDVLTVLYDGACPLCRREIAFYRRQNGANNVKWRDVSENGSGEVTPGISREDALGRFHVIGPTGEVYTGGRAFAELWAALPGFRLLGRLGRTTPLAWLLDQAYDFFLNVRPWLQRRFPANDIQGCGQ